MGRSVERMVSSMVASVEGENSSWLSWEAPLGWSSRGGGVWVGKVAERFGRIWVGTGIHHGGFDQLTGLIDQRLLDLNGLGFLAGPVLVCLGDNQSDRIDTIGGEEALDELVYVYLLGKDLGT
jgi:hypothetical protein